MGSAKLVNMWTKLQRLISGAELQRVSSVENIVTGRLTKACVVKVSPCMGNSLGIILICKMSTSTLRIREDYR